VRKQEHCGTKDRIINTAIILFSEKGYSKVSVRDIANLVGIKAASLYNHFRSKEEILHLLYDYYFENLYKVLPDIDELIKQVESQHPFDLFKKLDIRYNKDIQENMDRIAIIGFMEWKTDKKSEEFVKKALLDLTNDFIRPLLERMIKLRKIEALDIDTFVCLISNLTFSFTLRNFSTYPVLNDLRLPALHLAFSLIKPIEQAG
jgi:AcrR family transcriptional regulator